MVSCFGEGAVYAKPGRRQDGRRCPDRLAWAQLEDAREHVEEVAGGPFWGDLWKEVKVGRALP